MKYRIEKWLQNDIGQKDLKNLKPICIDINTDDKFCINFGTYDESQNVSMRAELEAKNQNEALAKFNEHLENILSKLVFVSTTPINVLTQTPTLIIKFVDDKERVGMVQVPETEQQDRFISSSDNLIDEGFDDYLKILSDPEEFKKMDEYKIPLSFFRQAIINPYPMALLFQYFAIEALVKPTKIKPICQKCKANFTCDCEGKVYEYEAKSSKDLKKVMDDMGFDPIVKEGLEKLRHKFSHGNVDTFQGLVIIGDIAKDLSSDLNRQLELLQKKREDASKVAMERCAKKEITYIFQDENLSKIMTEQSVLHGRLYNNLFDEIGLKYRDYVFKKIFPDRGIPPKYFTRRSYSRQYFTYNVANISDEEVTLDKIRHTEDTLNLAGHNKITCVNHEPSSF